MTTQLDPLDGANATDIGIDALRAELAKVEVSPDFAKRVLTTIEWSPGSASAERFGGPPEPWRRWSDPGTTLGNELNAIEVSPAFAVRVRTAIEEQSTRRTWFPLNWRWAVPVTAAAVIGAVVFMRTGWDTSRPSEAPTIAANEPRQGPAPAIEQRAEPVPAAPVRGVTRVSAQPTGETIAANVNASEQALEVITNQPAILRQLWSQVSLAPTQVEAAESLPVEPRDVSVELVEVKVVTVKWLDEPPPAAEVLPIIRRISAEAERSAK